MNNVRRRLRARALVVPALAGALLLGGCGTDDRAAARVGDTSVEAGDVDALASTQCALAGDQAGGVTKRYLRNTSLDLLIQSEVVRQLVEEEGVEQYDGDQFRQQVSSLKQTLAKAPADERDRVLDILTDYTRNDLRLRELATQELRDEGTRNPTNEQIQERQQELFAEYRKDVDVEVDPAYSPDESGDPGQEDGSLSTPVSDYAKEAAKPQPDQGWAGSLPGKLTCG